MYMTIYICVVAYKPGIPSLFKGGRLDVYAESLCGNATVAEG